ncbi:MAG: hypothetical protein IPK69_06945 [Phycisphaerales bacterium]|nr:MAG: hypothetical protein IPK69_06945 [Phycisphaerales bacterium]
MSMLSKKIVTQARELWEQDRALDAGKLIFDSIPTESQPRWAARILTLVVDRTGLKSKPVLHVIQIAQSAQTWSLARGAFDDVRHEVLALSRVQARGEHASLRMSVLHLAEKVAKVTFNATDPLAKYDKDSGWKMATCLKDVLDLLKDEPFSAIAWRALNSLDSDDDGRNVKR